MQKVRKMKGMGLVVNRLHVKAPGIFRQGKPALPENGAHPGKGRTSGDPDGHIVRQVKSGRRPHSMAAGACGEPPCA